MTNKCGYEGCPMQTSGWVTHPLDYLTVPTRSITKNIIFKGKGINTFVVITVTAKTKWAQLLSFISLSYGASSKRGRVLTSGELESGEQSRVPLSRQLPQQSQQTGLKNQAKFLPSRTWLKAWAEALKRGGRDEMRGEEKRWREGDKARQVSVQRERDSCWGPRSTARRRRESENRPGPHWNDGGIVFLLLKVEGWWKKEAMNLIWWLNRHISVAAGHKDDQVQAQFVCICICLQILNGLWVEFSKAWLRFCRNNQ